jgi:hypothetical protein
MKMNIYKEEKILASIAGENSLINFFKNKNNIIYTIEPNIKTEGRHILKYVFEDNSFIIGIGDIIAEAILNEYRTELVDE